MKVFVMSVLCVLCLLLRRCDCCLDAAIKEIIDTFKPSVETGPGRLVNRHRNDDSVTPDHPAVVIGHDGEWVKPTDDYSNVPTADYGDDGGGGAISSSSTSTGGNHRLRYSVRPRVSDTAVAAGSGPAKLRPDDHRPISDFIVSVLETIQLTSRAKLKKSKEKCFKVADSAKATTTTDGGIPEAQQPESSTGASGPEP